MGPENLECGPCRTGSCARHQIAIQVQGVAHLNSRGRIDAGEAIVAVSSKRWERAMAIINELAVTSPFYDHNGCAYCARHVSSNGSDPHASDCLYQRAVELARE